MSSHTLSQDRKMRVLSVGAAAAASLYMLVVFVAEPTRSLAVASNVTVAYTVTSALSMTCGTNTANGQSSTGTILGSGSSGTGAVSTAKCVPITNNSLGYTLSWNITTGTGAVGSRTGTGHLNSYFAGDRIRAMTPTTASVPQQFDNTTENSARWGARLLATSTTVGGSTVSWGSDGETETYLNIGTGSAIGIAKRTTETSSTGDIELISFKVVIPSGIYQPTGTYKSLVTFTAVDN